MEYHERDAIFAYGHGLDRDIDTSQWDIKAIPPEHLAGFRAWCVLRLGYARERLSEPDDPADQAWWHERCNEWSDILVTLREQEAPHA